jgi:hypothetical protein
MGISVFTIMIKSPPTILCHREIIGAEKQLICVDGRGIIGSVILRMRNEYGQSKENSPVGGEQDGHDAGGQAPF